MAKQMGTLVKGRWPETRMLALIEVHELIQMHWSKLAGMQSAMANARELFTHRKNIWPDQCERLLEKLDIISKLTQDFYGFLNMSDQLPLVVCPLRYPLVKSLHRIDIFLHELHLLILVFTSSRQNTPRQAQQKQMEIQQKLDYLLQEWREAQHHVEILLGQIEGSLQDKVSESHSHKKPLKFKAKKDPLPES
ncbi:MAG TPA: hypothetical protein VFA09_21925 [Ktedonobacteraceae bacterium]|nr:hypothetical protein [Ktedonobacteraceae bacterium]